MGLDSNSRISANSNLHLIQLKGMIHEVGRRILIEKTEVKISHDTVPLIPNGEIFGVWQLLHAIKADNPRDSTTYELGDSAE
jgi:hypothetical protein